MKHFLRSTLVALSLFSLPVLADPPQKPAAQAEEETLTLRAGNSKALKIEGVTRVAVEDPEIADVNVAGGNVIRVDGLKAGQTKLVVWTGKARKAYRIVVAK